MKPSRPYHSSTAYHREPGGLRRLDFFVDRIDKWRRSRDPSTIRILDVGCGNGNIALPLARIGYTVTGADIDEMSIANAQQSAEDLQLDSATFVVSSLNRMSEVLFDVIIASEVLEHQKDPVTFLAEIARHLAPGGLFLLSVPNGKSLEERIRRFTTHTSVGRWIKARMKRVILQQDVQSAVKNPHEQFFSLRALRSLLFANGWRVYDVRPAAAIFKEFYYLVGRLCIRRGSRMFHSLDAFDDACVRRLPLSVADGWLIEAKRFDPSRPLVLQILPMLASGGAERLVYDISVRLIAEGFDVEVIAILRGGPLEPLFRGSIPLTILNVRGLFGISAIRALVRIMRCEHPAIVHTHLFGADVWGRIAAWIARVPVIVSTEHNINVEHGWLHRRVKGWLVPLTTRFIAPADAVKRNMVAREYIPARKITIIPNGIDMTRVRVRSPHGFHDVPRCITVGRLVPQKGYAVLFKALALVKSPWILEVIGSGPLEHALQAITERLRIDSRIHWMGTREDVPERLAVSDVFLSPSRWEGFGLALLEAAAAGLPCIASDLPVFHEFLAKDDVTFVEPGNVPSFAHAIAAILHDPFSSIARARVVGERLRKINSVDVSARAYAVLYQELLKKSADNKSSRLLVPDS